MSHQYFYPKEVKCFICLEVMKTVFDQTDNAMATSVGSQTILSGHCSNHTVCEIKKSKKHQKVNII